MGAAALAGNPSAVIMGAGSCGGAHARPLGAALGGLPWGRPLGAALGAQSLGPDHGAQSFSRERAKAADVGAGAWAAGLMGPRGQGGQGGGRGGRRPGPRGADTMGGRLFVSVVSSS